MISISDKACQTGEKINPIWESKDPIDLEMQIHFRILLLMYVVKILGTGFNIL
jgi:hypothetical protein